MNLLKTYAISPEYIMSDNNADELKGHCLITPRCLLNKDLFLHINSALTRAGFKWSSNRRAWIKKMKKSCFKQNIMAFFKKAPQRVSHQGTDQAQDAKQEIKKLRQEQRKVATQLKHQDAVFEHKRDNFMYRLQKADSDPHFQRASYTYGQQIKLLAEQGIYDYPEPPKLP
jgi:alanine racemase